MDPHTKPSTPSKAPSPGEDVLRVIADVESQLAQLRQFHADHQGKHEEMVAREATLREQEAAFSHREGKLAEQAQAVEAAKGGVEALRASLSQQERALHERGQAAAEREHELAREREALAAERRAVAGEREQALRSIEERQKSLAARERQLEVSGASIAKERGAVEALAAELGEREKSAAAGLARAERWEREGPLLQKRIEELERAVEVMHANAERAKASMDAAHAAHREELEARDSILSEQAQEINDHREKLAVAKTKLQEVSGALKERMMLVTHAGGGADELRRSFAGQEQAWSAERASLLAKIAEFSGAGNGQGHAKAALGQAEQVVAGLNKEVEQLRSRLTGLERENAGLSTRLLEGERGGRSGPIAPERIRRRQARLALARRLISERQLKMAQAGEVLHQRAEECSRILSQRAELAQAHHAIVAMRRAAEARAARGRSAASIFYAVLTIALILGLSWTIADHVAPATYLARATLAADARGRTLADGELEEWQRFHEALLSDPQFVEHAADHMKRRGLGSLAAPGALRARMDADLIASSGSPGELILEWRGEGAGHAARELDTLASALSSRANSARARRVDGAATIVSVQAVPIGEAIADARPIYAGAIAVGGSVLTLLAGILTWKRLSRAKQRFEHEAHLEEVLDASNWPPGAKPA